METKSIGLAHKVIIGTMLTMMLGVLSGCSDSELEEKNRQLQQIRTVNIQLVSKVRELTHMNKSIEKKLDTLRSNNNKLDISLAKSELEFSKKHKTEIEAQRAKLDSERESFHQEKQKIKSEAYGNAERALSKKYLMVLEVVSIFLIVLLALLILRLRGDKKKIENLKKEKENEKKEKEECKGKMDQFARDVEELKKKQQEGCINHVISKIDTASTRRKELLESLRGDEYGK